MSDEKDVSKLLSRRRIFIVLLICAGLSGWLFYREFSQSDVDWNLISFTPASALFLFLAVLMMAFRDLAYMVRIRILTEKILSWRQCFRVIFLWEFASAVTPGVVGGSAVAMFILRREGIPLGKSTALVIITAIMDNLFYIVFIPLLFLFIPVTTLLPEHLDNIREGGLTIFWIGFGLILAINLLLFASVFIFPNLVGNILLFIFRLPFLKSRKDKAEKVGSDVSIASAELKGKSFFFWLKIFGATVWSWTSRYLVINFVLLAFVETGLMDQLIILGRQLVMWLVLIVTPTPGGTGMAEFLFGELLADFIKNGALALSLAFVWRLISYYPYLIIGSIILPRWLGKRT
jgi:glycosyltransferase 2 family protein